MISFLLKTVKIRLGDLRFSDTEQEKPPIIDGKNLLTDGNHRMRALLKKKGPTHEIEIQQWKIPFFMIMYGAATLEFMKWGIFKAKALYSSRM